MNANNNSQQPPLPPPTGATIQIDMETSGNPSATSSSPSPDSFGVLRGRLMDGLRRVMLPPTTATGPHSHTGNSSYSVFRQQPDAAPTIHLDLHSTSPAAVAAGGGHRYVPYSSVAVQNAPHIASTTAASGGVTSQFPEAPHSNPRTPPTHAHTDDPFYPPALGGLHDEDLPGTGTGASGAASPTADDNQRNVETFTDAMAQHPELRSFVVAVLKTLPFILIVLAKLAYDNLHALINMAFLGGIFLHANLHLKKEITKKQQSSLKKLAFLQLIIVFGVLIKLLDDPYIVDVLTMLSYHTAHTFHELLYYLIMADLCVKCTTVAVKALITMLPERLVEFKGRGRIYLLVEAISQFYRCFLPAQPWAAYLLNNYEGYDKIFGTLLVVAYVFWKFQEVLTAGKFLRESYIKFRQNSNFGTTPSSAETDAVGNQCPICHESFTCPIALECGHIFCDLCIGVWFDRETTCPLCRKKITDDPRYRDGSTSFIVQFA